MVKFNLTNSIQLNATWLYPWLGAGSWYLEGKPVKLNVILNNLCNLVMQQLTSQSTDNQSSKCLPVQDGFILLCCAIFGRTTLSCVHGNDMCQYIIATTGGLWVTHPFSCTESLQPSLELSLWFNIQKMPFQSGRYSS